MNTPAPADLSKLKGILGNAKALINKDNSSHVHGGQRGGGQRQPQQRQAPERDGYGPTPNVQYLSEAEMMAQQGQAQMQMQQHTMGDPTRQPGVISEEAFANSRMPEAVKQMMRKNPTPQVQMNHSFNLDDVADLVETRQPQMQQPRMQQPQRMNENAIIQNKANDTFTVSETALRGIIKDVLMEYLSADYSKNLTEATIKKTINTLIKEGKIKTKPKA